MRMANPLMAYPQMTIFSTGWRTLGNELLPLYLWSLHCSVRNHSFTFCSVPLCVVFAWHFLFNLVDHGEFLRLQRHFFNLRLWWMIWPGLWVAVIARHWLLFGCLQQSTIIVLLLSLGSKACVVRKLGPSKIESWLLSMEYFLSFPVSCFCLSPSLPFS